MVDAARGESLPQQAFGHGAAAGISSADEEDVHVK
jgi:hypothetical protein